MHHHDNPTGHMRPRQVRRILALMWFGAALAFVALLVALPKSDASPGQCGQGFGFGSGGGFCDYDPWPDGSFMHSETVYVLGFGGTNVFRACNDGHGGRVATDYDPATPC